VNGVKLSMAARLLFCFCLTVAFGCSKSNSVGRRIDVAVINHTGAELDKVNIQFGKRACYVGILATDALAVHMYFEPPVGETAAVRWTEPDGKEKKSTVRLGSGFSRGKAGQLTFEMRTNGVVASFLEFDANGKLQSGRPKP